VTIQFAAAVTWAQASVSAARRSAHVASIGSTTGIAIVRMT
jgi:hypothetical protein